MAFNRRSTNPVANPELVKRSQAMLNFKKGDEVTVGGGIKATISHFDHKLGTVGVVMGTRVMSVNPLSLEKYEPKKKE